MVPLNAVPYEVVAAAAFFDGAKIIFSKSLKIDRLVSIVVGTENFADRSSFASKSKAQNSDGVF
jgi:hypothetical protein